MLGPGSGCRHSAVLRLESLRRVHLSGAHRQTVTHCSDPKGKSNTQQEQKGRSLVEACVCNAGCDTQVTEEEANQTWSQGKNQESSHTATYLLAIVRTLALSLVHAWRRFPAFDGERCDVRVMAVDPLIALIGSRAGGRAKERQDTKQSQ